MIGFAAMGGLLRAAPAGDHGVPVHTVDGSSVRDWLALGPFPARSLDNDFLAGAGGEANVRPKEGDTFTTKDGKRLVWTRLHSDRDVVDLERVFGPLKWSVIYVYCELDSATACETDARILAMPAGGVLWLDGKVMGRLTTRPRFDLSPVVPIRLRAGRNSCLMKLQFEFEPPYGFAFQPLPPQRTTAQFHVTDVAGRALNGARIQIYEQGKLLTRLGTDAAGQAEACLCPPAESYDFRLTWGDLGAWLEGVSLQPGARRKLDVVLTNAVSISGSVLALDGTPQNAIVVQALRAPESARAGAEGGATRGRGPEQARKKGPAWALRGGFCEAPRLRGAESASTPSLLPMPPFSETVLSDTNGHFQFVNLRPGRYRLRAHGAHGYVYPQGEKAAGTSGGIWVKPGRTQDGTKFVFAEAKEGVWKSYPIKKGLVALTPSVIDRTPDGRLWVGTDQQTVLAFDGVAFKTYSAPDLPGNYVRAIAHDSLGAVWVGTDKGISRIVNGRIEVPPFDDTLPGKDVGSIATGSDGAVWFGTTSGLCRYDRGRLTRWGVKNGAPSNEIGALLRTRDGGLWMSSPRSLARFDGKKFVELAQLSGLRQVTSERLFQARDGAIWFCSPDYELGAYRYDGKTLTRLGKEEGLASDKIYRVAQTSDGVLWFATSRGLSRFDGKTILNYTAADGLGAGDVRDIFVDSDDVIWCATLSGVSRFDPKGFRGITKQDGLLNRQKQTASVFAIEPDGQHGYWLGTEWGGVYHLGGRRLDLLRKANFGDEDYVRHILRAHDGALWLGTSDGLYEVEGGRAVRVLRRKWIIGLNQDDQGRLWFGQGWIGGGVSRYNPKTGHATSFTHSQGLPDDAVWAIEPAADGGVWIGTDGGLAKFKDGKIEDIGKKLGLPTGPVRCLRRDSAGTLWVGGAKGLFRLKGTHWDSIRASNGVPVEDVWCSTRTPDGILWVGTDEDGLLGYDGRAVTRLDTRDGLLGNSILSLRSDADGSLLIGFLGKGLGRYRRSKTRPSVHLTVVTLADQTYSEFTNLPTTETGKRVTIQYQEVDLKTLPIKRQFWYQITGPSGRALFGGVTKDRQFEWTPQKPGHYSFTVQAIDRDLNYSAPTQVSIRAYVPWYADAWILVPGAGGVAALILFSGISGWRYRIKRLETERLREEMLRQEREAREALAQSNRALQTANQAKSQFLASMSHEIRTPLNAVLGYAKILERDEALSTDQRRSIVRIERNGEHLLALINEILDLSKIEAGQEALRETDFDLHELIHSLDVVFEPRCREKGLEWRTEWQEMPAARTAPSVSHSMNRELPPGPGLRQSSGALARDVAGGPERRRATAVQDAAAPPRALTPIPVHGDAGKLRQVLINLLGNAVKFTDRGHVTLRVIQQGSPALEPTRHTFVFEVEDSGSGVPDTLRARIFEPFTQGTESGLREGTGLGLAIAQHQVELMGGSIQIHSAPGQGSRFSFALLLPPAREPLPAATGPRRVRLRAGSAVHALVADDVAENRDVLGRFLQELGVTVREVAHGPQALEALRAERFDIAFLDIRMPGMNGLEVARHILEGPPDDRPKLVAISASALQHEQDQYREAGFEDVVPKPFQMEDLVRCLESQLGLPLDAEESLPTPVLEGHDTDDFEQGAAIHSNDLEGPIDWERLEELFGKDLAAQRQYLEQYVRTASEQIEGIREALQTSDLAQVDLLAHRCRGMSANFGLRAMVGPTERLEEAARAGKTSDCERLFAEVQAAFEAIRRAI